MSWLTDLIAEAKAKDPQFGADLEREFRAISSRLSFGLNFERHQPEAVELPTRRPVRKGDKVRVLPPPVPPPKATNGCGGCVVPSVTLVAPCRAHKIENDFSQV